LAECRDRGLEDELVVITDRCRHHSTCSEVC